MIYKQNKLRTALLMGSMAVAAMALSGAASAAEGELETVVVTGSMLKHSDLTLASPLTVLSRDNIDAKGLTTVSDVLRSLTSDSSGTIPTAFGSGFAAGSSGVALRGLSVNSTLVLINGRRTSNYPLADDGERSFVDLNTIPMDAVERVEVLKDGASSQYGADAIGGVVNIIMKTEFKGIEGTAEFGTSQHGGGDRKRLTASVGWGDLSTDHYNAYINLEYQDDQRIPISARGFPYNTDDLSSLPNGVDNTGTSFSVYGKVAPAYMANQANPIGANVLVTPKAAGYQILNPNGCGELGVLSTASSGQYCKQNSNLYGNVQPKERRYGIYAHTTVQFDANTQGYIDASYFVNNVWTQSAPAGISSSTPHVASNIALPAYLLNGQLNPYDPFAVAGCSGANNPTGTGPKCVDAMIKYNFGDIKRGSNYSDDVFRMSAGLTGSRWGWDYDIGLVAAHSQLTVNQYGYISYSGLMTAIENGTYNFYDPSKNSAEVRNAVSPGYNKASTTDMDSFDIRVSRELFTLPGGPVSLGMGVEARHEGTHDPDLNPNKDTQGLGQAHTIGSRTLYAAYGEVDIPLFKDTVVGKADVDLSGRYDHYSDFGDSWVPKVAAKWQVLNELMLRGTWSRGFRAPSFSENGSSESTGFVTITPPASWQALHPGSDYRLAYSIGENTTANPDIKPETSRNYTLGAVLTPFDDRMFSVTFDYYSIKKRNVIQSADFSEVIAAAFSGAPIPAGYGVVWDNPDSLNPNAPVRPLTVSAPYINANSISTEGWDLNIQAGTEIFPGLSYQTEVNLTQIMSYLVDTGSGKDQYVGTESSYNMSSGAGTPRWRGSWSNTFSYDKLSVTGTFNLVSGEKEIGLDSSGTDCLYPGEDGVSGLYGRCAFGDFWTMDLNTSYQLYSNVKVFFGIDNLFDAKPPINAANYAGNNWNPTYHQSGIVGRYFSFGVTLKN